MSRESPESKTLGHVVKVADSQDSGDQRKHDRQRVFWSAAFDKGRDYWKSMDDP